MSKHSEQSDRMARAVERKNAEARERSEASRLQQEEDSLSGHDRPQDEIDPRAKNSGHKKKTADKWNQ